MQGIADYSFAEVLGTGNHGTYYKAQPPARLGYEADWVAVKVLEQHAGDDDFRRFANELKLFATVDSEYLVQLLDAGQDAGRLFYATEYHPLGSLAAPAGDLDDASKVRAVAHAARGAHALHEVGVAHRDIKPTNILLENGGGRLGDLGLAQVLNPGQTVTGTGPIGSIEFMAPSMVRGERASRASDIWELGATLHKVLTGRSVFGDIPTDNILEALRHVLQTPPRIDDALPDPVRVVLESCLASAPEDRPQTAEQLAEQLEALT